MTPSKPSAQTQGTYQSMLEVRQKLWQNALRFAFMSGGIVAIILLIMAATLL